MEEEIPHFEMHEDRLRSITEGTIFFSEFAYHFCPIEQVIVATAVLFNIARLWGDDHDGLEEEDLDDAPPPDMPEERGSAIVQEGDPASVRLRGQTERDRLKDNMRN